MMLALLELLDQLLASFYVHDHDYQLPPFGLVSSLFPVLPTTLGNLEQKTYIVNDPVYKMLIQNAEYIVML